MSAVVDKSGDRVREMFGEISPRYDFLNHLLSGGTDYYWRWRTVRACPPSGDAPILDVCTGTGDLAIAYWKKAGGKRAVYGTDFTPQMLEIAREKFRMVAGGEFEEARRASEGGSTSDPRLRIGLPDSTSVMDCPPHPGPLPHGGEGTGTSSQRRTPNAERLPITFQEADTQALPFDSDTFQIVSVAFGLRNVSDTRRGLAEMIRVCKPGGHVVVLEFSLPGNRLLRGLYLWYFRNILPKIGQLLARNQQSAYNYLPASVAEFPYGQALADLMQECGLSKVKWTPLTFGIATMYIGEKSVGGGL